MEYYFTEPENVTAESLIITGDEFKHLAKVLRKNAGDIIYVTDGKKNLFKTQIESVRSDLIKCSILERLVNLNEPKIKVMLFPALLKNPSRFEFIVEKSVELGVHEISPVITEYVINKTHNKADRWQSIAFSAMKQSQRCFLPTVNKPLNFDEAIGSQENDALKIIADERYFDNNINADELRRLVHKDRDVCIFTGPEGGFTGEEIGSAVRRGFSVLNLGERKLRSETAAIAILSLILTK